MMGAAGLVLVGCSSEPNKIADKDSALPPSEVKEAKIATQPKGLNLGSPATSPVIPPATKIAVRDGDDLTPNPPATVVAMQQDIDTAPANQKPDVETRIANLEAQLAALRADYDRIVPTFKKLSVNADRLVSLMNELEDGATVANIAPAAGPTMALGIKGQSVVQDIRFGQHGNKTRIVMDVSDLSEYNYRIDNDARTMTIRMPQATWSAKAKGMSDLSDLVSSWQYQPLGEKGSMLILDLRQPVKQIGGNALPPNGEKGPRIYIDIAPSFDT